MSYYRTCPYCGAHLDPGERCDCREGQSGANSQTFGNLQKNAPASATNAGGGGVDQISTSVSISSIAEPAVFVNG